MPSRLHGRLRTRLHEAAGPEHWNDLDLPEVGNGGMTGVHVDTGAYGDRFTAAVPPHGVVMLRITPVSPGECAEEAQMS